MKAIEFVPKGGVHKVVETEQPEPKANEVLIQVVAAAIDTALPEAVDQTFVGKHLHSPETPLYLGWHYSGKIEAVGSDVATLKVGDEVFGHLAYAPTTVQGSFSEYITVPETECAVKPASVSHETAAAAPTESLTALQALRDNGELEEGKKQSVLVVGAAGSVGSLAVQIAKQLGAHVTAVCRTKDVETVKTLGADEVIDRMTTDPLQTKQTFDIVFDTPAAYSPSSCFKLLNRGGTYVVTVPSFSLLTGWLLSMFTTKKVRMVMCLSKQQDLELVGSWLEKGALSVPIDSTFKARDIQQAMNRYAEKDKKGRVAINVLDGF